MTESATTESTMTASQKYIYLSEVEETTKRSPGQKTGFHGVQDGQLEVADH